MPPVSAEHHYISSTSQLDVVKVASNFVMYNALWEFVWMAASFQIVFITFAPLLDR